MTWQLRRGQDLSHLGHAGLLQRLSFIRFWHGKLWVRFTGSGADLRAARSHTLISPLLGLNRRWVLPTSRAVG